jgi:hypothetical protein
MVLEIPVWYLHPPAMVPQPSLPPQTEGIPMQIPILTPTAPPSPPLASTTTTTGGRRKKKDPTTPLPPRVQPPCTLCEKEGHPTNKCPSLPELHNLINFLEQPHHSSLHPVHQVLPPHPQLQVAKGCEPNSHVPSVQSMAITPTISLHYLNFDRH